MTKEFNSFLDFFFKKILKNHRLFSSHFGHESFEKTISVSKKRCQYFWKRRWGLVQFSVHWRNPCFSDEWQKAPCFPRKNTRFHQKIWEIHQLIEIPFFIATANAMQSDERQMFVKWRKTTNNSFRIDQVYKNCLNRTWYFITIITKYIRHPSWVLHKIFCKILYAL